MKKRKATAKAVVKKGRTATIQKTGAPPAYFLLALERVNSVEFIVNSTRKERAPLAQESTEDITKRVWRDLLELSSRVLYPRMTRKGFENAGEHLSAIAIIDSRLQEAFRALAQRADL